MPAAQPNDTERDLIVATKRALRAAVRLRRASRAPQRRAEADHARTTRLVEFLGARHAGSNDGTDSLTVAAYLSSEDEPGTLEFVAWCAARDVPVLLPVQRGDVPDWADYSGPDGLQLGRHDILEPSGPALGPGTVAGVDLIVLPGLAGNEQGDRLGQGAGWYDRALADVPGPVRVLLLNDDEVMAAIPTEASDQQVDVIITETRTIVCRPTPVA